MWQKLALAGMVVVAFAAGCSSSDSPSKESGSTAQAATCTLPTPVDRFKELMIVDDSVLGGARALNRSNGAFSFRRAMEAMIPPNKDKSEFVRSWMEDWENTRQINGYDTDTQPQSRADGIWIHMMCPWFQRTPENECNSSCTSCKKFTIDLAEAPFKPIAIINRMDLRLRPDLLADSPAGEARIVYGMTDGAADDPASQMLALTLVVEYALPRSMSAHDWATAWHELSTHPVLDEAYANELQTLADKFMVPNASPERKNGTAIVRLRANESVFNWIWQMRQFALDPGGELRLGTVTNTPAQQFNNTQELADYVKTNTAAIKSDTNILPDHFLAGSADQLSYKWELPGVDEDTRLAFARTTCNGCHAGEHPTVDTAFHISPYRHGIDKLSAFVHNPADLAHDELGIREQIATTELCQTTGAPAPAPASP